MERLRFDSLWLSERVGGESPDPVVGMAYAAGRTRRLKFGTSVMVLPGRNPVLVAKALASLDRMSGGRLLPAFGLGVADAHEQQAFAIERSARAGWFDEALPLIRRLWTEDVVDHHGERFHLEGIGVLPKPVQKTTRGVAGGHRAVRAATCGTAGRRVVPPFITATRCGPRADHRGVADAHSREIDPRIRRARAVRDRPRADRVLAQLSRRRPDLDRALSCLPVSRALASTIEAFVENGASRSSWVLPLGEPTTGHVTSKRSPPPSSPSKPEFLGVLTRETDTRDQKKRVRTRTGEKAAMF